MPVERAEWLQRFAARLRELEWHVDRRVASDAALAQWDVVPDQLPEAAAEAFSNIVSSDSFHGPGPTARRRDLDELRAELQAFVRPDYRLPVAGLTASPARQGSIADPQQPLRRKIDS